MAAEGVPKPRVNGSILPKCTGKTVSIVAKYIRVSRGTSCEVSKIVAVSVSLLRNYCVLAPKHAHYFSLG